MSLGHGLVLKRFAVLVENEAQRSQVLHFRALVGRVGLVQCNDHCPLLHAMGQRGVDGGLVSGIVGHGSVEERALSLFSPEPQDRAFALLPAT